MVQGEGCRYRLLFLIHINYRRDSERDREKDRIVRRVIAENEEARVVRRVRC